MPCSPAFDAERHGAAALKRLRAVARNKVPLGGIESGSWILGRGGLLDGYQGAGRTGVDDAELSLVIRLAREEGVMFDPVYTAKAFGGLLDTLQRDPKALGQRVCFIHTGGIFSLFPLREPLTRLLDS